MSQNFERRIKKQIYAPLHDLRILCPLGLAKVCATEATEICQFFFHPQLSPPSVQVDENGVFLSGIDFRNMMQLCLQMKTARDILWIIASRRVTSKQTLANALEKIEWDIFLPSGAEVAVRVNSLRSRLYHEGMIEEIFQKTIKQKGFHPNTKDQATNLIDLRLDRDKLMVSLSLSGNNLFRREFKQKLIAAASMKEDLAACATIWAEAFAKEHQALQGDEPIIILTPFAGSGTLGFEAAMRFGAIPLSMLPRTLAFERFPCTPEASLRHIRKKLEAASLKSRGFSLRFADVAADQYAALKENITAFFQAIPVRDVCDVAAAQTDVFNDTKWYGNLIGDVFIPLNPPYGLRLNLKDASKVYKQTGAWLRRLLDTDCKSISGYIFTPDILTARAFAEETKDLITEAFEVSHGGRKVQLIAFTQKKPFAGTQKHLEITPGFPIA